MTRVPDSFEWDVFLSHSSLDKPRVERLAQRLQAAGLRVWFDAEDIAQGGDIVQAIEHGVAHSRVLILCMTKNTFESEWVELERNSATFRDPTNKLKRFLPVRFEECEIPPFERRLNYIDWVSESDEAFSAILSQLDPESKPLPETPLEEWNPYDPFTPALGSRFVGREVELKRLRKAMEAGHSVSVVGDWRIGKTSLLAAFADQARTTGRVDRHLNAAPTTYFSRQKNLSEKTESVSG